MLNLILILILNALLIAIAFYKGEEWLRWLIAVQMIVVTVTARKLFDFGFGVSNIASLCFATVFLIETLIYFRFGLEAAQKTIQTSIFALIGFVLLRILVVYTDPTVAGNEELTEAYRTIVKTIPQIPIASFLGFFCSMQVLLLVLHLFEKQILVAYLIGMICAQIVDSLIFFPIVFGGGAFSGETLKIVATGFTIKIIVGLILAPILLLSGFGNIGILRK